jgi:uncharacterized protein (TIGR03435 family)
VTLRTESRELPVLNLVVARGDGKLGPDIKPSTCLQAAAPPAATVDEAFQRSVAVPHQFGKPCIALRFAQGAFLAEGATVAELASILANFPAIDRPVVERTGLTNVFDFRLTFVGVNAGPDAGPTIFTALKEQLGLELQPGNSMMPLLIVDSAHAPLEN